MVSNDRLDFLAVLRAFRPDAEIPMPASGRWGHAGMVRGGGPDLAWRTMDAQYWASPRLARRERIFLVADFGGRRAGEILFKPRPMLPVPPPGTAGRVPAAQGDRGPFLQAGGRVPVTRPFQMFRMRGAAKNQEHVQFRDSFGFPADPFPTLLAGAVTPFAFWFEDDPLGGCVRFPTERECERLMGLPEGWTKYGADGVGYFLPTVTKPWATPSPCPAPTTSWRGSQRRWAAPGNKSHRKTQIKLRRWRLCRDHGNETQTIRSRAGAADGPSGWSAA